MDEKAKKHEKNIFIEELDNKLKQTEDSEEYKKEIQSKIQGNKNFESGKNLKSNRKILAILGGIITFFVIFSPIAYTVGIISTTLPGASVSSLFLVGGFFSIILAVRVYNLISGENININEWITDKLT